MSAPARLLALRLHGFKSFAERTNVEFGPGISAVVGPNGSGKSNLADALRWTLGEQGRALRSRKAEDVIWAGSERRSAQGMADVTLVVDNSDGLIPVEYQVLELGRRLYRSGENDYLLNRQRIRLRDLVDLLDSAHLADNAFLFIGQGMVDQALALRPEERRPLFEEVAGVRRHERRRRRAEDQLTESEANLSRAQDILGELRPQVRRLAAQAEQQSTRRSAGAELADALVLSAHGRWHEAAARLAVAFAERDRLEAAFHEALAGQVDAERAAAEVSGRLDARASLERELGGMHEAARTTVVELQLRDARLLAEEEAIARDRERHVVERSAAEADQGMARRATSVAVVPRDRDLEAALAEADRALADALAQLTDLRTSHQAQGEERAALQRAEAARVAEIETARRRHADAEHRLAEEMERSAELDGRRTAAIARHEADAERVAAETSVLSEAAARRDTVRATVERLEGARGAVSERLTKRDHEVADVRGRLEAIERRIATDSERGIARAARRRGGRQVNADLLIDATLRAAVETALADRQRAYVIGRDAVGPLADEVGSLIVEERVTAAAGPEPAADRRLRDRVAELGGGSLFDAVRRDASGAVRRMLARALWLPDLESCLELQPALSPGWVVVTRDGTAAVTDIAVVFGAPEGTLEWQASAADLRSEAETRVEAAGHARLELERLDAELAAAREALSTATARQRASEAARRAAEESERRTARDAESVFREVGWREAQVARLAAEVDRLRGAVPVEGDVSASPAAADPAVTDDARAALVAWDRRAADLRERRDALAAEVVVQDRAIRGAQEVRARAEAAVAAAEARIARSDADAAETSERARRLAVERQSIGDALADARPREEHARARLDEVRAEDHDERERLSAAEAALATARDRVRGLEDRSRAADRSHLEARLALEALREQVLVELAGLGSDGLERLARVSASASPDGPQESIGDAPADATDPDAGDADGTELDAGDPEVEALEAALEIAATTWASEPLAGDLPTSGRLASLRRRYHELGAANPYAIEEYDEIRQRLSEMEAQETDLRSAIASTRELIGELNTLIATQFRSTFVSLESAFDERFRQLFGGGYARLALTDPEDLSTTGVEIIARPPGKKPQALAMLSGGERALTAVALLFAMLTVRPVPFCVLDEVDAALDEANVGRFADVLRELSERTQFIVITHNRGTIEKADALYGVTVGDDSVSRVISLRLEEAQAIAARASNGSSADVLDAEPVVG